MGERFTQERWEGDLAGLGEASQRRLQPSTAQAFSETYTPTPSPGPKWGHLSVRDFPGAPGLIPSQAAGAEQQRCGQIQPPSPSSPPPAAVSGDPRSRVSPGRVPTDRPAQSPHNRVLHCATRASLSSGPPLARATLEVIFDPKGAPYRSCGRRQWPLDASGCTVQVPRSIPAGVPARRFPRGVLGLRSHP